MYCTVSVSNEEGSRIVRESLLCSGQWKMCSSEWCQTSVHFTQKISCALAFNGNGLFSRIGCVHAIFEMCDASHWHNHHVYFFSYFFHSSTLHCCVIFSEFDLSLCLDFVTSSAVSFRQLASRRSLLFDYLFVTRIVCVSICKVLKNLNRSCASNRV